MIDYTPLYQKMADYPGFEKWLNTLPGQVDKLIHQSNNGNWSCWLSALEQMPEIKPDHIDLDCAHITASTTDAISLQTKQRLEQQLRLLMPWRKGPFDLFDVKINTEWHSDWKWQRIQPHIASLKNRTVLDVGCGNGYHSWRMAGEGAKLTMGIDPSLLYVCQYQAIKKYLSTTLPVFVLPLKLEDLPQNLQTFDSIFSMGVLYHRRSPFDHLIHLLSLLRPGGELILETLIIEGSENTVLVPHDRYAMMNNVWFLPSATTMQQWLKRCGYKNIRIVDINKTSTEEQRTTDWMTYNSLQDFLDPENPSLTVEGYPAPLRATFIANRSK